MKYIEANPILGWPLFVVRGRVNERMRLDVDFCVRENSQKNLTVKYTLCT